MNGGANLVEEARMEYVHWLLAEEQYDMMWHREVWVLHVEGSTTSVSDEGW